VPSPPTGLIFIEGQVARPGPQNLSPSGKETLSQAITSAGGLIGTAIPGRVDLTRRLSGDREVTVRLNLAAIQEKKHPEIYMKPEDQVNVGTNFWALPLAVFRGGFRASYGFGFLLDRNFAGDVFGPDPTFQ